jgi:uncharacterized membrane protein YgdD (TMEM256/DUF423 family)
MDNTFRIIAGLCGAVAVILGAFGAHALESLLSETGRTSTYETAVSYHFYHSLLLLVVSLHTRRFKYVKWVFFIPLAGILLFSGSLYVLCIFNMPQLGIVTPFGGLLLIASWVLVVLCYKRKTEGFRLMV